ncbi:hypothetical protein [Sphingomonas glacialis]|uniref:hypothetical protein n=1 Tax=Sphingomonas glacialis TaxID=658225 RepID=UPI0011290DD0|nr:hypothetical protein [Sphingomonas glacialis]
MTRLTPRLDIYFFDRFHFGANAGRPMTYRKGFPLSNARQSMAGGSVADREHKEAEGSKSE